VHPLQRYKSSDKEVLLLKHFSPSFLVFFVLVFVLSFFDFEGIVSFLPGNHDFLADACVCVSEVSVMAIDWHKQAHIKTVHFEGFIRSQEFNFRLEN